MSTTSTYTQCDPTEATVTISATENETVEVLARLLLLAYLSDYQTKGIE